MTITLGRAHSIVASRYHSLTVSNSSDFNSTASVGPKTIEKYKRLLSELRAS